MCGEIKHLINKKQTEDKYLLKHKHTNECITKSDLDQQKVNNIYFLLII